jgi:hypothetical protein
MVTEKEIKKKEIKEIKNKEINKNYKKLLIAKKQRRKKGTLKIHELLNEAGI